MSKKTTKTAHVMSILTKNSSPNEADFQNNGTMDSTGAEEFLLEQETDSKISQAVQNGLLELLDNENTSIFTPPIENIKILPNHLTQALEYNTSSTDFSSSPQSIESLKLGKATTEPESPFKHSSAKMRLSENYMVIPEISEKPTFAAPPNSECGIEYPSDCQSPTRYDPLTTIKEFTPELFFDPEDDDKFPDSYFTEKEKNKMTNYEVTKIHSKSEDYICVNVVEEITAAMLTDVMDRFGLCKCEKCKADVMAISLNDLTPKYVGTSKGQLFVKLAGYEKQYATDVLSALTKACIHVKSNPRHPDEV